MITRKDHCPKAFTLTELIVVIVIVGMIATFGIPNFRKLARKGYARNAILHLETIHGADEIYKARNNEYLPGNGLSLAQINSGLSLDINDNDMTYSYTSADTSGDGKEDAYTATASYAGDVNFSIRITEGTVTTGNPCCSAGTCPMLSACP